MRLQQIVNPARSGATAITESLNVGNAVGVCSCDSDSFRVRVATTDAGGFSVGEGVGFAVGDGAGDGNGTLIGSVGVRAGAIGNVGDGARHSWGDGQQP